MSRGRTQGEASCGDCHEKNQYDLSYLGMNGASQVRDMEVKLRSRTNTVQEGIHEEIYSTVPKHTHNRLARTHVLSIITVS